MIALMVWAIVLGVALIIFAAALLVSTLIDNIELSWRAIEIIVAFVVAWLIVGLAIIIILVGLSAQEV